MGAFVLIIVLVSADARPAIDHIYFGDSLSCEHAKSRVTRPGIPNVEIAFAECIPAK